MNVKDELSFILDDSDKTASDNEDNKPKAKAIKRKAKQDKAKAEKVKKPVLIKTPIIKIKNTDTRYMWHAELKLALEDIAKHIETTSNERTVTIVDIYGGSAILSYYCKQFAPAWNVIYNDEDNISDKFKALLVDKYEHYMDNIIITHFQTNDVLQFMKDVTEYIKTNIAEDSYIVYLINSPTFNINILQYLVSDCNVILFDSSKDLNTCYLHVYRVCHEMFKNNEDKAVTPLNKYEIIYKSNNDYIAYNHLHECNVI